jgi:hypothetical protein
VVRWERQGDRVILRAVGFDAVADDSLPIALSVASNNVGPILAAFPIAAFTRDSASTVVDVTDFFTGDTPVLSGLSATQRRTYGCGARPASARYQRRAFPQNVEVRHTQTLDAGEPPEREAGTARCSRSSSPHGADVPR